VERVEGRAAAEGEAEPSAWLRGPQQKLFLLPVLLLPLVVVIAIAERSPEAGLAFPALLACLGASIVVWAVVSATSFVEISGSQVRYRNWGRARVVPLADVLRFEVAKTAVGYCAGLRLRTGRLIPLVATLGEWISPEWSARSASDALQATLADLRSD
jgi:hypothetical protein